MSRYLGLAVISFLLVGCSAAPVQEMSDARQAIHAATQAGAETRSPSVLSKARRHLVVAETALEKGEYRRARKSALRAKQQAVKARLISINGP